MLCVTGVYLKGIIFLSSSLNVSRLNLLHFLFLLAIYDD